MKRTVLVATLALLGACVFAQERTAIAVFPFEDMDNLFTQNESVLFYRRFSNEFVNKNNNRFRVIPRQDVEKLINTEAKFQLSDFSAQTKTAEMQRVLNGSQILSGYIGKMGNKVTVSISLFIYPDLEQLPGGVDIDVADKDELFTKIPNLVQNILTVITKAGNMSTPLYKIGDTGPAGGIVFYDKGSFSDGWRYLEAAPYSSEFTASWGANEKDVTNTMDTIGSGKQNTKYIIEKLTQLGGYNSAAHLCATLDINGYKDWFLPSKDELDLMYLFLKQRGLGEFKGYYWSSSQYGNSHKHAWSIDFNRGFGSYSTRISNYRVRAVRAF